MAEQRNGATRLISSPLLWTGLICCAIAGVIFLRQFASSESARADQLSAGLPILSSVPEFRLVDQNAAPFGRRELEGRVWVANFMFSRCPTICPKLSRKMAEFQQLTAATEPLHLVSFTVDPEHDTPDVLRKYGEKYGARWGRWSFLTGSIEEMKGAIEEGLRVSMGRNGDVTNVNEILHGPQFVLVDRECRIRGYYDVEREEGLEKLAADALLLASAGAAHGALPEGPVR